MIDFEKRLHALKDRRQGTKERAMFASFESYDSNSAALKGQDIRIKEGFEQLEEPIGVKYAIGAMAAVNESSTKVSIEEGKRVAESLTKSLSVHGESVTSRLQGSVALDIHIKGHSDVDMLIIVRNPISVENPKVSQSAYGISTDNRSLVNIVKDVRNKSEIILPINFPKADIDCLGSKSIALEGGSLKRKVDIVPACWHDSINYQHSQQEHDRGIKIYDKDEHELILNYPFLHIHRVNQKDATYSGNLKCAIRLMKNMIADMPEYKKKVVKALSSYDLAAIGYHMNHELQLPTYMRLGLVEKIKSHLQTLLVLDSYRDTLYVPDETRKIFNDDKKVEALTILAKEFEDLSVAIFNELKPYHTTYDPSVLLEKYVF